MDSWLYNQPLSPLEYLLVMIIKILFKIVDV